MYFYTYDGSFEGLLTTIFEIYERKLTPDKICPLGQEQPGLFAQTIVVTTQETKANRVWQGLANKISVEARQNLFKAFLSEQPAIEMLIYGYVKLAFASKTSIEENFAADCVRELAHINKQVFRESHRMEAFIRFQKTADDLYYATVAPDFNVLPLVQEHFAKRYADQRWLIYDSKRHFGFYYDLEKVAYVDLENQTTDRSGKLPLDVLAQHETLYQSLWQTYFKHVNIPERKNPKLHLRHIPRRYWRYLTEKQTAFTTLPSTDTKAIG